jgi:predicted transposase/invertase (TIGR01784 family)
MSKKLKPHDSFFKSALAIPKVAQEFLQMHLPAGVLEKLDLNKLEIRPESFIDKSLKKQFTDVLFACKTKDNEDALAFLLCEHQVRSDPWMSYRLFKYMFAVLDKYRKANPEAKKLPLFFPLVFYNGRTTYTADRSLHQLFVEPEIAKQILYNEYHLIDAQKIPDDELKQENLAKIMEYFMKHAHKRDFITNGACISRNHQKCCWL